jgi:flagellar capping protein FliD
MKIYFRISDTETGDPLFEGTLDDPKGSFFASIGKLFQAGMSGASPSIERQLSFLSAATIDRFTKIQKKMASLEEKLKILNEIGAKLEDFETSTTSRLEAIEVKVNVVGNLSDDMKTKLDGLSDKP